MDLWTHRRYGRPRLDVEAVVLDPQGPSVGLATGGQVYRLAFDDAEAAHGIAAKLEALRTPDAPFWNEVRGTASGEPWDAILTFLDERSLLKETDGCAVEAIASEVSRLQAAIAETLDSAFAGTSSLVRGAIRRNAKELVDTLSAPPDADTLLPQGHDPFCPRVEPNFYLGLLKAESAYLRSASPQSFAALRAFLALAAEDGPAASRFSGDPALQGSAGLFDERDFTAHLWLAADALKRSAGADAMRMPVASSSDTSLSNGLEFMRRTEHLTRDTLALWGPNPYVVALQALNGRYSPLIAGPFIEQFHVTRRFLEIIAPLLCQRFAPPLRKQLFQYFGEEFGHEALEGTTCAALGASEAALDKAIPLPHHFAFVDVLTLLARIDPIASFGSIMAIEGVFGEPPRMSLRLKAIARGHPAFDAIDGDHDALNDNLNHNSIARDLLSHVSAVDPARQRIARNRIIFLLELNHIAWGQLADFYGSQSTLTLLGPYGTALDPSA